MNLSNEKAMFGGTSCARDRFSSLWVPMYSHLMDDRMLNVNLICKTVVRRYRETDKGGAVRVIKEIFQPQKSFERYTVMPLF